MAISKKVQTFMENASWIRKMFEQGALLKKQYGADKVYDFSLGNPNVEPPESFFDRLKDAVGTRIPLQHGYMSNAGYPETRQAVAEYLSEEHGIEMFGDHIVMTCGAGGALNVALKTLLDPGDEVIVPVPYFVEYNFYIDNYGGVAKLVKTTDDFNLDAAAIGAAITDRTKAVLINSPNNPTGRVYDQKTVGELGALLDRESRRLGREIYLISDEPYSKIVYDGVRVPSILQAYTNSLIITSYSKDLSLPGERLGYIAVNPALTPLDAMMGGLVFCNRTLGFVNAPAIMQRVVRHLQGLSVDIDFYKRKRDRFCDLLAGMGYEFHKPEGAFYLFPKAPTDDVQFAMALQKERILVVPGSGFGCPGYFRIAYCVDDAVIEGSAEGFAAVAKKYFP
ncbi:MAG: pyridoxal phosphate-dependent aminotransferase, partial [Deltaproteobacteria bacterium]|nr:pyridoxal phosphate-dependent aminotransferase [Deltaproteobacteria bacterium]